MLIESVRIGTYLLILLIAVLSTFVQSDYTNWGLLKPFYMVLTLGFLQHLIILFASKYFVRNKKYLALSFVFDAILISALIYLSHLNQSLFLFLYLVNIMICGLVYESKGAIRIALFTAICFTSVSVFGPEIKALAFLFMLLLNDLAFFATAIISGYLGEQMNILGQKIHEQSESIKALQDINEIIIENIPAGLLMFDSNGVVVRGNPQLGSCLDKNIENIYNELPHLREKAEQVKLNNKVEKFDLNFKNSDLEKIFGITLSDVNLPEVNQHVFLALIEDLTQLRRLEFSLRQSEKLAAVGGLAAGIAHEIRNPLASISGSIEMLSQTVSNEDDRKLMRIVLKEIDRLNNLITEFLDYAKPEKPPTESVQLNDLLTDTLNSIKRNTNVRKDIVEELALNDVPPILGNRDKLKQVFLNIILNSFQAMESSAEPKILIQTSMQGNLVSVLIKDSGCGMDEQTRKRMFEPFHTTKPKGTGLGLAITHKILDSHSAQIFVESEKNKGTSFVLQFPTTLQS